MSNDPGHHLESALNRLASCRVAKPSDSPMYQTPDELVGIVGERAADELADFIAKQIADWEKSKVSPR